MLKGIPYWGESTFEDMRTLARKFEEVQIEDYVSASDMFTLFHELGSKNYVFILREKDGTFFSWCKDIRFDYRDKVVYIPYYTYSEKSVKTSKEYKHLDRIGDTINVHYGFQARLMPVYVPTLNYKIAELYVANIEELAIFRVQISENYLEDSPSIDQLYRAYLNASYFDEEWSQIDFKNNYHWIGAEKGLNMEYAVRASQHLPVWALKDNREATPQCKKFLNCCDIRLYDLQTIQTMFDFDLHTELQYWERRYLFDAYLLFSVMSGKAWRELEFNERWKQLGTKYEFIKYGSSDFPLYLKHYYKLDDKFNRRSYEKYVIYRDMKVFEE